MVNLQDELPIRVISSHQEGRENVPAIQVLSQKMADRILYTQTIVNAGRFHNLLEAMSGAFKKLVGMKEALDIRVIQLLPNTPPEIIVIPRQDVESDDRLPISVLRAHLTAKRTSDRKSWGEKNPDAKMAAYAEVGDSGFDLPTHVISSNRSEGEVTHSEAGSINVLSSSQIPVGERIPTIIYDQDWTGRQVNQLNATYGQELLDTPIHLNQHHLQEYTFGGKRYQGQSVSTCLAATVYNSLDAIGRLGSTTEDQLIADGQFLNNGSMDVSSASGMLSRRNVQNYPIDSLVEIARVLEQSGVVILLSNWHAKLISGMTSKGHGEVQFRVNDPLNPKQLTWTSQQLAENIATGVNDTRTISGIASPFDFTCIAVQTNLDIRVE